MSPDIDVHIGAHRFNYCVRSIIRRDGAVLVCALPATTWCFLPGGRVRAGETTREALTRELEEELGVRAPIGALAIIVESFFPHLGSRFHELGFYYSVDVPESVDPTARPDAENGAMFRWIPVEHLAEADLRPKVLCEVLARELEGVGHYVYVE
jgi:8-oxo-dGTP pyrophosphatase MutT (NUDIX family)